MRTDPDWNNDKNGTYIYDKALEVTRRSRLRIVAWIRLAMLLRGAYEQ